MSLVRVDVDVLLEQKLRDFFRLGEKKIRWAVADSMTSAGKDAAAHLARVTPDYVNKPTRYTLRGISAWPWYVKPQDLNQWVGFRKKPTDEASYLAPMAEGAKRQQKPSERRLASSGVRGRFIQPTGFAPLKLNTYGNVSKAMLTKALSGGGEKAAGQFFVAQLPGRKAPAVYARKRGKARGITRVLSLSNAQPRYRVNFPVGRLLSARYQQRLSAALTLYLRRKL